MWNGNRYAIYTKAQDYCIGKIIVLINFEPTIKEEVNATLSMTGVSNKLKIRKGNLKITSQNQEEQLVKKNPGMAFQYHGHEHKSF